MEFRYPQGMTTLDDRQPGPPEVEVVIEIPLGSFLKRGSNGHVDFISPFPCPFNYGCVPAYIGGEGDLLDAVVLGPRLPLGSRVKVPAWGAIGLSERFMYDDKLICSVEPLSDHQRHRALRSTFTPAARDGSISGGAAGGRPAARVGVPPTQLSRALNPLGRIGKAQGYLSRLG